MSCILQIGPKYTEFYFYFHRVNLNRYAVLQNLHEVALHAPRSADEIHCPITNVHVHGTSVGKIHH